METPIPHNEITLPVIASKQQLVQACKKYSPLSLQTRLSPGHELAIEDAPLGATNWSGRIAGNYGIQMVTPSDSVFTVNSRDKLVIAQLGFKLRENELVITNSPQGISRKRFEDRGYTYDQIREAMAQLHSTDTAGNDFRDVLLNSTIAVANLLKGLGVKRIVGRAAENHPKVKVNLISLERAKKSMDHLYKKHGFRRLTNEELDLELDPDIDYVLDLQ